MPDPSIKISGDPRNGFIIELHDGDRYLAHPVMADDENAAVASAQRHWDGVKDQPRADRTTLVIDDSQSASHVVSESHD